MRTKKNRNYEYFLLFFIFNTLIFFRSAASGHKIKLSMFYSPGCDKCISVKKEILIPLEERYKERLEIVYYNIDEIENYKKLLEMEKQYNITGSTVPVIFMGNFVLNGEEEIKAKIFASLDICLENKAQSFASVSQAENYREEKTAEGRQAAYIAYFFSPGCKKCSRVYYDIRYLKSKYNNLVIKEFNIQKESDKQLNEAICEKLGVPEDRRLIVPSIFIGKDYLISENISLKKLEDLLRKYSGSAEPLEPVWNVTNDAREQAAKKITERFTSIGIAAIMFAGVLDGINPCAFATIIFFVSYLTYIGRKKREILFTGASFTIAIFLAYFLIGIGVLSFINGLTFLPLLSKIVYILTACFAVFLGIYNLYDYCQIRNGNLSSMELQLPVFLKKRIHKTIREKSGAGNYVIAAFVMGFTVSLLELACTGQVYLPTIIFASKMTTLRIRALFLILLYNFMFILPLVVIFFVVYFGINSSQLAGFMQKHAMSIKLLTALLFFVLALVLILTI